MEEEAEELDEEGNESGYNGEEVAYDEYGEPIAPVRRTTLWWPVVLFLLSRYPIVPQLQLM